MREPCTQLQEEHAARGYRRCKGPEVRACMVFEEQEEVGGREAEKRSGNSRDEGRFPLSRFCLALWASGFHCGRGRSYFRVWVRGATQSVLPWEGPLWLLCRAGRGRGVGVEAGKTGGIGSWIIAIIQMKV